MIDILWSHCKPTQQNTVTREVFFPWTTRASWWLRGTATTRRRRCGSRDHGDTGGKGEPSRDCLQAAAAVLVARGWGGKQQLLADASGSIGSGQSEGGMCPPYPSDVLPMSFSIQEVSFAPKIPLAYTGIQAPLVSGSVVFNCFLALVYHRAYKPKGEKMESRSNRTMLWQTLLVGLLGSSLWTVKLLSSDWILQYLVLLPLNLFGVECDHFYWTGFHASPFTSIFLHYGFILLPITVLAEYLLHKFSSYSDVSSALHGICSTSPFSEQILLIFFYFFILFCKVCFHPISRSLLQTRSPWPRVLCSYLWLGLCDWLCLWKVQLLWWFTDGNLVFKGSRIWSINCYKIKTKAWSWYQKLTGRTWKGEGKILILQYAHTVSVCLENTFQCKVPSGFLQWILLWSNI